MMKDMRKIILFGLLFVGIQEQIALGSSAPDHSSDSKDDESTTKAMIFFNEKTHRQEGAKSKGKCIGKCDSKKSYLYRFKKSKDTHTHSSDATIEHGGTSAEMFFNDKTKRLEGAKSHGKCTGKCDSKTSDWFNFKKAMYHPNEKDTKSRNSTKVYYDPNWKMEGFKSDKKCEGKCTSKMVVPYHLPKAPSAKSSSTSQDSAQFYYDKDLNLEGFEYAGKCKGKCTSKAKVSYASKKSSSTKKNVPQAHQKTSHPKKTENGSTPGYQPQNTSQPQSQRHK